MLTSRRELSQTFLVLKSRSPRLIATSHFQTCLTHSLKLNFFHPVLKSWPHDPFNHRFNLNLDLLNPSFKSLPQSLQSLRILILTSISTIMSANPTSSSASPNLLYRFPDAQILLGPLENISFASVPPSLYYPSDIMLCCGFCNNVAISSDTHLIDLILSLRCIQCDPEPGFPRCQSGPHSNWHLDIKFALYVVPTFLQPAVPVIPPLPTNSLMPASLPHQPTTSAGQSSILRVLLSLPSSTDRGMVFPILPYHFKSHLISTNISNPMFPSFLCSIRWLTPTPSVMDLLVATTIEASILPQLTTHESIPEGIWFYWSHQTIWSSQVLYHSFHWILTKCLHFSTIFCILITHLPPAPLIPCDKRAPS